jgi:peptide chain release factor 1
MLKKLEKLKKEYEEIIIQLQSNIVYENKDLYISLTTKEKELREIVFLYNEYLKVESDMKEFELNKEYKILYQEAKKEAEILYNKIIEYFKEPEDNRNVILEIKAAAGGEEACLFAYDLFRMYSLYSNKQGWDVEIINYNGNNKQIKEVTAIISGNNVYSKLKYENGVHRVQRVPETESKGRVQTSTVSVIILPEAKESQITINLDDCKFDKCRASGNGGQCVNTTDSAVRLTHLPTGIVIYSQTEKSQHQNKSKALTILQARLKQIAKEEKLEKESKIHKEIIKNQDRAEKTKTYNYKENRYTDHVINYTCYNLQSILNGNLDEIIQKYTIETK